MAGSQVSSPELETHQLSCVADCGIVPPVVVEALWIIPPLGLLLALLWLGARRLARRRKPTRFGDG
jgi:hypothetical protein